MMLSNIFKLNLFKIISIFLLSTSYSYAASDISTPFDIQSDVLAEKAEGIDREVLDLALNAYHEAKARGVATDSKLAVIDYSIPSSKPRLWIFDLDQNKVLYKLHVAHGQKSGLHESTKFSNKPESHQTSIGVFVTQETYHGRNGYSLRLDGLEEGFNDKARDRAIVMHGAAYVKESYIKANGRLGRSHGCPAIDPRVAKEVINELKEGNVIFAYYPDKDWLSQSEFL
jgi:hypothetical protein